MISDDLLPAKNEKLPRVLRKICTLDDTEERGVPPFYDLALIWHCFGNDYKYT